MDSEPRYDELRKHVSEIYQLGEALLLICVEDIEVSVHRQQDTLNQKDT